MLTFVLIGCCKYYGFGFTTLNPIEKYSKLYKFQLQLHWN